MPREKIMAEERKRYLKEKILNEIKNVGDSGISLEELTISLEELKDCFFELDNMIKEQELYKE